MVGANGAITISRVKLRITPNSKLVSFATLSIKTTSLRTLSIMVIFATFSIMTLSMRTLRMRTFGILVLYVPISIRTVSIMLLFATLSISDTVYAEYLYAKWCQ